MNITQLHEFRQLTEREARASLTLMLHASKNARHKIGRWYFRRPTKNEILAVCLSLHAIEEVITEMARHPPGTDLSKVETLIAKHLKEEAPQ